MLMIETSHRGYTKSLERLPSEVREQVAKLDADPKTLNELASLPLVDQRLIVSMVQRGEFDNLHDAVLGQEDEIQQGAGMTTHVTIDEEFKDLCQPLSVEERKLLRDALVAEGCRDPIIAWDTKGHPVLDGHHRYQACCDEGIAFEVKLIKLPDREAALDWIARNQLGRRNASEEQKAYLRGKLFQSAKSHKGRPSNDLKFPQSEGIIASGTAERIAKQTGVSRATVERDAVFAEKVDELKKKSPELARAAREGDIPKASVPALAAAPKAALTKIESLEGKELRKAAKQVAVKVVKPKPGAQKKDPRLWGEIEGLLGRSLNRFDELNRQFPHSNLHRRAIACTKNAMDALEEWKKAVR